jgi:hypothetical protein
MKPFLRFGSLVLAAGVLTALMLHFAGNSHHQGTVAPNAPATSEPLRATPAAGEAMDTAMPELRPQAPAEATQGSPVSSDHSASPATQSLARPTTASAPAPSVPPVESPSYGNAPQSSGASPSKVVGAPVADTPAGGGSSAVPLATDGIIYEIDSGVKAPVALAGTGEPLPPPQAAAIEQIGQEFDRAVAAGGDTEEAWEAARKAADERYRLLFGDEAFNQKTIREAREALEAGRAANP